MICPKPSQVTQVASGTSRTVGLRDSQRSVPLDHPTEVTRLLLGTRERRDVGKLVRSIASVGANL